ncbi:translation initiation factor IF-2-like [Branchiostoma floridae]|uniref:Translation initiation factor IF-2-like n=1 Tax=Branchiostoma floridae TaxID=7739 RepID=A0A9J7MIH3_BRAFL|nr:translation initiation factor IF-2-like [Branchiostoma floridae]
MQKLKLEAEETEKERQVEMEKLQLEAGKLKLEAEKEKLEAEEKEKELHVEMENLKMEAEGNEKERQVEIEKLKLQAEDKKKERQETEVERRDQLEMRQLGPERGVAAETESVRAKIPKLPAFEDGTDDLDAFLQRFERIATSNGWKETTWASTLSALLNGTALEVYSRLNDYDARDYNKVKEALMKRYNLTEDGFRAKFRHNQPEKGESPEQFLVRLTKYLDRWVDLSETTRDYESLPDLFIREQFMEACPVDLATHVRERALQSMKEMADMAQHFLEAHKRELATRVDTVEVNNPGGARVVKKCYNCNSPEHLARACPQVRQLMGPSQATSLYASNGKVRGYECDGEVEGTPVTMSLDTGSSVRGPHPQGTGV